MTVMNLYKKYYTYNFFHQCYQIRMHCYNLFFHRIHSLISRNKSEIHCINFFLFGYYNVGYVDMEYPCLKGIFLMEGK